MIFDVAYKKLIANFLNTIRLGARSLKNSPIVRRRKRHHFRELVTHLRAITSNIKSFQILEIFNLEFIYKLVLSKNILFIFINFQTINNPHTIRIWRIFGRIIWASQLVQSFLALMGLRT